MNLKRFGPKIKAKVECSYQPSPDLKHLCIASKFLKANIIFNLKMKIY